MKDHIQLNYHIFDKYGIEKKNTNNNKPWKLKCLHISPPVFEIENFFTKDECIQYKNIVNDNNDCKSVKVNSATFGDSISKRTSTTWYCYYKNVPTLLAKAKRLLGGNETIVNKFEEA